MRSLLDVNFIIALLDPDHTFQERAHQWLSKNGKSGWASCPLTENSVVRIMSTPGYSRKMRFSPNAMIAQLQKFVGETDHEFWSDEISILDASLFDTGRILGPKQIADLYLLALATKHRARLVTFDKNITLSTVNNAKTENLCVV